MIVYKITNTVDGKQYVGVTIQPLQKRWRQHCRFDGSVLLNNAIKKYGPQMFQHEILEECETEEAMFSREMYWIQTLNTQKPYGYNICPGGNKPPSSTGLKRSAAHKEAIRQAQLGHSLSRERQEKMRLARTKTGVVGAKHTPETKQKMSLARKQYWANKKGNTCH